MAIREPESWDAELYGKTARYMSAFGEPLIEMLAAKPGERVLDLGCGDGELAQKIAHTGASVVGVDSSEAMVLQARRRGVEAWVADGTDLGFANEFDAVFSNSALHWMSPADEVILQVRRALRSGGRFVGELGADGNVRAIFEGLRQALGRRGRDFDELNPFYFPAMAEYESLLLGGGFGVERMEVYDHRTSIPGDVGGWLRNFGATFFAGFNDAEKADLIAEVVEVVRPELCDRQGRWWVDHRRLRFLAGAV